MLWSTEGFPPTLSQSMSLAITRKTPVGSCSSKSLASTSARTRIQVFSTPDHGWFCRNAGAIGDLLWSIAVISSLRENGRSLDRAAKKTPCPVCQSLLDEYGYTRLGAGCCSGKGVGRNRVNRTQRLFYHYAKSERALGENAPLHGHSWRMRVPIEGDPR
jgi:hypothetical protein